MGKCLMMRTDEDYKKIPPCSIQRTRAGGFKGKEVFQNFVLSELQFNLSYQFAYLSATNNWSMRIFRIDYNKLTR